VTHWEVAIIGAGTAGMAAAIEAAGAGLAVLVLDEQAAPGGQAHRAIEAREAKNDDDREGARLTALFRQSAATYWPEAAVWQVEKLPGGAGFSLCLNRKGETLRIRARHLLIAVGAIERPVPIPGWTLPGVMTVGAAQILLKTGGNVPAGRVVIAGQGPLPLLYATQLIKAGVRPQAFLDTTPAGAFRRALPHLAGAAANAGAVLRGLGFYADIRKAGVPLIRGVEALEAKGEGRVTAVRYRTSSGWHDAAADLLLLHEGIVPHTHLALSIGVAHGWDEAQLCWKPVLGADGQTSVDGVRIAGDAGGINGWRIAELDGRLAGLAVAAELGKDVSTVALRQARTRLAKLRPFLDAWYRPRAELLAPANDVIVCRCEEKTAGAIRAAIREGCLGSNQVKAATRCGMGPCQGRECGLTLTTLIAAERGVTPVEAGSLSIRPPLKPLTLGELASLAPSDG